MFSAGEVSLKEQSGNEAAAKVLIELGQRGMTVAELITFLERLKWEQELRLLKPPGNINVSCFERRRI